MRLLEASSREGGDSARRARFAALSAKVDGFLAVALLAVCFGLVVLLVLIARRVLLGLLVLLVLLVMLVLICLLGRLVDLVVVVRIVVFTLLAIRIILGCFGWFTLRCFLFLVGLRDLRMLGPALVLDRLKGHPLIVEPFVEIHQVERNENQRDSKWLSWNSKFSLSPRATERLL